MPKFFALSLWILISNIILGYQLRTYSFDKYLTKKLSKPEVLLLQKHKYKTIKEIKYNDNLLISLSKFSITSI
mgnify:CR=1 FL=1